MASGKLETAGYLTAMGLSLAFLYAALPPAIDGCLHVGSIATRAIDDGIDWISESISQRTLDPK